MVSGVDVPECSTGVVSSSQSAVPVAIFGRLSDQITRVEETWLPRRRLLEPVALRRCLLVDQYRSGGTELTPPRCLVVDAAQAFSWAITCALVGAELHGR
jgi:hypothetical protein